MTISLLTLKLFQKYMSFFLLLNKEDILKSVGIQTVDFHIMEENTVEVNGDSQLFGTNIQSILCSTAERNSYRYGTNGRGVNNDSIFIFG